MNSSQTSDPLIGVRLKIERAKQHIRDLDEQIRAFVERDPYQVVAESDRKGGDQIFRLRVIEEIPARWAVIVGEMAYQLRSALDHLAWAAVVGESGQPQRCLSLRGDGTE